MTTRGLVITAGDCARDPATTDAIIGLAKAGAITATALIPVSPDAPRAAAALRPLTEPSRRALPSAGPAGPPALPRPIAVRLQVTLSGRPGCGPWRPVSPMTTLVRDGVLPDDPAWPAEHAHPDEVAIEIAAQHTWMVAHRLRPDGIDADDSTVDNAPWPAAIGFCSRHALALRLPRDPARYLPDAGPDTRDRHLATVAACDRAGIRLPAAAVTNRRTAADLGGYQGLLDHCVALLGTLPATGTSELVLHPAPLGAPGVSEADPVRTWELRMLTDPAWQEAVGAAGFTPVRSW